jgi:hypothetical protein
MRSSREYSPSSICLRTKAERNVFEVLISLKGVSGVIGIPSAASPTASDQLFPGLYTAAEIPIFSEVASNSDSNAVENAEETDAENDPSKEEDVKSGAGSLAKL